MSGGGGVGVGGRGGGGRGGGGMGKRGSVRDLGKRTDYLLIFVSEWTSGDWCAHVSLSLCLLDSPFRDVMS